MMATRDNLTEALRLKEHIGLTVRFLEVLRACAPATLFLSPLSCICVFTSEIVFHAGGAGERDGLCVRASLRVFVGVSVLTCLPVCVCVCCSCTFHRQTWTTLREVQAGLAQKQSEYESVSRRVAVLEVPPASLIPHGKYSTFHPQSSVKRLLEEMALLRQRRVAAAPLVRPVPVAPRRPPSPPGDSVRVMLYLLMLGDQMRVSLLQLRLQGPPQRLFPLRPPLPEHLPLLEHRL